MRVLTAGESHGPALVGILEGMPAGVPVNRDELAVALARRRLGYGASPRMVFEQDQFDILGGVRHGQTLGSPIAVVIHNTEWPKWVDAMGVDTPEDLEALHQTGRGAMLTRPRPGHADLVGVVKYDRDDVRDILERASARETAMRVALAYFARKLLHEVGIEVLSHVRTIGGVSIPDDVPIPTPDDLSVIDADSVRCIHPPTAQAMIERIEQAKANLDTVGGTVEVLAYGLPIGLGSHVHADRKLDAAIAGGLMSIQAMKAIGFGLGQAVATVPGSMAHDAMMPDPDRPWVVNREGQRAGGVEGGMSTGGVLAVQAHMKPLASLMRPLPTVDLATGEAAQAVTQRSDVCAVPRAGVVCEAVVAQTLATFLLEKTGGDSLDEVKRNLAAYRSTTWRPRGQATTVVQGDPVAGGHYLTPEGGRGDHQDRFGAAAPPQSNTAIQTDSQ